MRQIKSISIISKGSSFHSEKCRFWKTEKHGDCTCYPKWLVDKMKYYESPEYFQHLINSGQIKIEYE